MGLLGVRELCWHMVACGPLGSVTVTVTSFCAEPQCSHHHRLLR